MGEGVWKEVLLGGHSFRTILHNHAEKNRRGAWRNGPPPAGSFPHSRGGSPALGQSPTPRMSINDHMHDLKIVQGERKGFQTDTDISRAAGPVERELQPWVPDGPSPPPQSNGGSGNADFETFGTTNNITWDQFETNERLFGAKTDFKEELYTTKLNKSGPDFHKREKEAERLAKQIMGVGGFYEMCAFADGLVANE